MTLISLGSTNLTKVVHNIPTSILNITFISFSLTSNTEDISTSITLDFFYILRVKKRKIYLNNSILKINI